MNATQSFKIYEILQKHFQNDADAKALVAEIEQVVQTKIAEQKDVLSIKEDIYNLKEDISRLEIKLESRFNSVIMWMMGTGIGIVGLIFTIIKLFVV